MDLAIPTTSLGELAAAFFQLVITLGLAGVCGALYREYRKPYFMAWTTAWLVFALRLGAIVTFMLTENRVWLYWHQVTTGWTALAFLWAALVFSRQLKWKNRYFYIVAFPPLWSYVAIYQLDNFILAAGPAVLFLSLATLWTGWVLLKHHRAVRSTAALIIAVTMFLWALHHLDYPFLRARGIWNPWGYYLDTFFSLTVGCGVLLLVVEELQRGLRAVSNLSGELHRRGDESAIVDGLLGTMEQLPGVKGSALYLTHGPEGQFVGATGVCKEWEAVDPTAGIGQVIERVTVSGRPEVVRDVGAVPWRTHPYNAALPVLQGNNVSGVLVIVGDARDPFAALDERFLLTLGRQVGAAMDNNDLYRRLASRTDELERLAARMVQQHEEERRYLSRELHDETAQVFSAVKLQLGVVKESVDAELGGRLARVLELVDTGIKSIRNVTQDLRPSLLDDLGLIPALRALIQDFSDRTSLPVFFDPPPADTKVKVSGDGELAVFRALQEGLANVVRHAGASQVDVKVWADADNLYVSVEDDGCGIPDGATFETLERTGHMGLAGMRERIGALGGKVSIVRNTKGGAKLAVQAPLNG